MPNKQGVQTPPQAPTASSLSDLGDLVPLPAPADEPAPPPADPIRRARLLVVFVCLALLATNVWLVVEARAHAIAQAHLANTNLARAMIERVEGSVSEADHILDSLVDELERADLSPPVLERLQPILVNHVARTEQLKGLFVYDAHGAWIATSEPRWDASWNNADRSYFIHHRASRSASTLVSQPIVSRSSGEWIVPVSRRLNDAEGNFAGVALATLSVRHLRSLLERFDVGEGAILLTSSGRMVARNPFLESDIGKPLPPSVVSRLLDTQRSGTADARSPIDGVERLFSFEHARNYPLQITVAAGKNQVLQNWRTISVLQTVWVVFLCLLLERAGSYTSRTIAQRLQAENGLREASDALTRANGRLAKLAQFDDLTRLPNRRYFDQRLGRVFRQAQRERSPLAIAMVDVDEFKKYNDHYGHVEGDECLRRVAAALRASVKRPEDVVARYGGEEMVLLLPHTDALGATLVAEAARVAVAGMDIPHAAVVAGKVTISVGVAAWVPGQQDTEQALLKAADAALYEAKHEGRNRVHLHA
ncbi:GGDEF domain-containing protein [Pseudorhodoferax sp.]|uniref:GGDEF domain-containing protein n=1 Tax=Pseudorhodoferax sp. TaxID=1993553 RepID=UPI002DD639D0|nr:sensor domain-containing diguanylate cyclase [Pseudorhodoferax sp.]